MHQFFYLVALQQFFITFEVSLLSVNIDISVFTCLILFRLLRSLTRQSVLIQMANILILNWYFLLTKFALFSAQTGMGKNCCSTKRTTGATRLLRLFREKLKLN
jgi:hypothetical protein